MKTQIHKRDVVSVVYTQHMARCYAIAAITNGIRGTPWFGVHDIVRANKNGVGRGSTLWLEVPCNDLKCGGMLRVHIDSVLP